MKITSAVDATRFFEPGLGSDRGALVVRHVLDQARNVPELDPSAINLTDEEAGLLDIRHRIDPLVRRAWPGSDGAEASRQIAMTQLRLTEIAHVVVGWLAAESIDCRVLKGLATGRLDYSDPILRQTADVDLIVPLDEFDAAEIAILANGCTTQGTERIPGLLMKGSTLMHPSGTEIDLHYRIDRHFPAVPGPLLLADPVPIDDVLLAFPGELRLIHAAHHAVASGLSHRQMSSVADIVAIIDNTGVDWNRARALADEFGLTATVGEALRMEALIMQRDPHPGLEWPRLSGFGARIFLSHERGKMSTHVLALQNLPPGVSKAEYVWRWVVPSRAYIEQIGGLTQYGKAVFRGLHE